MTFSIASVTPDSILSDGGRELRVTGVFEAGHEYRVYMGDLGTSGDPPCYSGVSSQGYSVKPRSSVAGGSLDLLVVFSARTNPNVTAYSIVAIDEDTLEAHLLSGVITAVKKQFFTSVYSTKSMYHPKYKTGPRNIESEEPT